MAKFHPKTKKELADLVANTSIKLYDIDTSLITDMSYLFVDKAYCDEMLGEDEIDNVCISHRKKNEWEGIENWNTSNVTTMEGMFAGNQELEMIKALRWNTLKVTNMNIMFANSNFCGDLSYFDTSSVVDMGGMFCDTCYFEGLGLEKWNVKNVLIFSSMFDGAKGLEIFHIAKWEVSKKADITYMFENIECLFDDLPKWYK